MITRPPQRFILKPAALGASLLAAAILVAACGGSDGTPAVAQPTLVARAKAILTVDGKQFKDLNGNGKLDAYEDWRLPVDDRINDLVSQMSDAEKVGMMMINDNNAGCGGTVTPTAIDYINNQKMTRFILRSTAGGTADACDGSVIPGRGGYTVTPQQLAAYTNAVQEVAESTHLGIPLVFKDNARNHVETDPRQGIGAGAGAFTQFPKEAGLAAAALGEQFLKEVKATTGDMSVMKTFTDVMGAEYNAVGLLTEPRWYQSKALATGDNPLFLNPLTGKTWGAEDPYRMFPAMNATCSDTSLAFGGALPWEIGDISFTGMAAATSRTMYPTLADIKAIMAEIGDAKKVVLSIYFRAPYVMDDASSLKNAGAITATFGVTDVAMLDVLSGKFKPQGKLPFALPKTLKAVQEQKSDLPGFDETTDGALYKFGYGLTY